MEFSKTQIRTLSMLGQRGAFGTALTDIARENEKIAALSADLCNTSGLDRFAKNYPDRFFNVGIAEQNLVGVSAGIADSGYIPFATTFAAFAAMRSCEFVRHFMGYMKANVKLVGLSAGFGMEYFGNTHYGVEDIAAIRSIPNITILSPADGLEVCKCVQKAAEIDGPVYIRLTGVMNNPIVYKEDYPFEIGKAIIHRKGTDIALIATGSVLKNALEAAKLLAAEGIEADVVDMPTIKPLDQDVLELLADRKLIFVIEEHSCIGGLGSAVAEYTALHGFNSRVVRMGTMDMYSKAGSYQYKISENGLDKDSIAQNVRTHLT